MTSLYAKTARPSTEFTIAQHLADARRCEQEAARCLQLDLDIEAARDWRRKAAIALRHAAVLEAYQQPDVPPPSASVTMTKGTAHDPPTAPPTTDRT